MDSYIWHAKRDTKVIGALNVALHTLVVHDGMLVRAEGNEWTLNFRSQIERVREAMEMLGIDTSEPLIAPPLERGDEGDDDGA
ncbi:hypothetical protein AB6809_34555 [Paraburkholderia sp. RCC_158]|uniref:hypothetical protein n=1 Tax=Paraburkholderia sp. RCC_158 TaxID=3239220 RepID=UPI0035231C0E